MLAENSAKSLRYTCVGQFEIFLLNIALLEFTNEDSPELTKRSSLTRNDIYYLGKVILKFT